MAEPVDQQSSPVLESLAAPSLVGRRNYSWGFLVGIGAILLLGVLVFTTLSHARQAARLATVQTQPQATPAPSRPTVVSNPPPIAPPEPSAATPLQTPSPSAPAPESDNARWKAPAMVVDLGDTSAGSLAGGTLAAASASPAGPRGESASRTQVASGQGTAEERFAEKVGSSAVETAHATRLTDVALVAPQGTVIPAVLETAINSDLPGFVRALVTRDVRGFDGTTVLIPRGSKLIGQYRSGVAAGQSRAFVIWSRIITPEGISIDIASPAADPLGRGGLQGETNTHFLRRFGGSILLSALTAGLEAVVGANTRANNTAIVIGSPQQATNIAAIALQKDIDVPTTITVAQGAPIRVFVARDLDFSAVFRRAQ